jgi:peptide/nickel transport system substrate-binding protein
MSELNYWQKMSLRRLGRRDVLRSAVLAGAGSALLAACGRGGGGGAKPAGSGASSAAGTPQRGGVLASRVPTDLATTWIPAGAITYNIVHPMAPAFNQLVQWDPQDADNKIIPDLADSYEQAGDAKSIVFKLHPGVKFHDGSDFSSEDVKATLDWTRNPPPKQVSSQQGILQVIDRVETPDPLTAKVILKQPSPALIGTLATHFGVMGAKADLAKENLGTIVNGTGPFKLKTLTRGVGVELERNPNYWVKDRPYLDGVKYSIVADDNTAMADLIAGRFHKYFPVVFDNVGRANRESAGKINEFHPPATNRNCLFFNGSKKPFNDPRVRQAVSLALDRNEAMQLDTRGMGRPGGYMLPGGSWAISSDQLKKVPGYDKPDIAEAKKLLAAAGVTEPVSGVLVNRSDTTFQPGMVYVQNALQKNLGWNFRNDVKDSASAFAAAAAGQFDLLHWIFSITFDDPDATFGQLLTGKAASNWSKISDPEADAIYDKQSQTVDAAQRKQLSQQAELKYLNNFPMLTLYFRDSPSAIWGTVQNFKVQRGLYVNQRHQDTWFSKA